MPEPERADPRSEVDESDGGAGAVDVVNAPARSRYELLLGGEVRGRVDYRIEPDGRVALIHAEVDRALRGKGYSEQMVRRTLDDVRASGQRALAKCSYVKEFAAGHPEYADLFA